MIWATKEQAFSRLERALEGTAASKELSSETAANAIWQSSLDLASSDQHRRHYLRLAMTLGLPRALQAHLHMRSSIFKH